MAVKHAEAMKAAAQAVYELGNIWDADDDYGQKIAKDVIVAFLNKLEPSEAMIDRYALVKPSDNIQDAGRIWNAMRDQLIEELI